MGLFPRYDKEGPGVYADDPKKGPFVRFFQTYSNKFLKIMSINLMFVLFNIPSFVLAFFGVLYFLPQMNPVFEPTAFQQKLVEIGAIAADNTSAGESAAMQLYLIMVMVIVMFVVGMQLVTVGPVQAGFSYIFRSYARETTTFLWTDFVSAFKNNWKQSTIVTVITLIVTGLMTLNIGFYGNTYTGQFAQIFSSLFFIAMIFYMCIQLYIYPLIASLDLKLRSIYRNAALFFLGRLIPTLGIFLADVAVLLIIPAVLLYSFSNAGVALVIIYYLLFAFSFVHYLNTFFVWQQIERYIVKPQEDEGKSTETTA